MRILVINYEYPPVGGGGGEVSQFLAEGYSQNGHDVRILTAHWDGLPKNEIVHDRLSINRIFAFRKDADRCSPFRMAAFALMALPEAFLIARKWRPDIVHCHFAVPVAPVGFFLKCLFHIPFVVTLHGGDVPGHQPAQTGKYFRFIKPMTGMILKRAEGIVAVSEHLRELAENAFPGVSIQLIPNGVDVDLYHPAPDDEKTKKMQFIYVGRFNREKRLDILLEATRNLLDSGKREFSVRLVGAGPLEKDLREKIKDWNLTETVCFTGWISREKVAVELRNSHVFALPSEHEGMPIACLQAMASGLPIIGTKIRGIQQIVRDRENGILTDVGDAGSLARGMGYLIDHPELCKQWGQNNREMAYRDFRWDVVVANYLDLFERITKEKHAE